MKTIDEVGKYRKKKYGSKSKASKRSNHKHEYKECIIKYKNSYLGGGESYHLSSYCKTCGKIGGMLKDSIVTDYRQSEYNEHFKRMVYFTLSGEELYERYKDKLPLFHADFFDECVDLKEANDD